MKFNIEVCIGLCGKKPRKQTIDWKVILVWLQEGKFWCHNFFIGVRLLIGWNVFLYHNVNLNKSLLNCLVTFRKFSVACCRPKTRECHKHLKVEVYIQPFIDLTLKPSVEVLSIFFYWSLLGKESLFLVIWGLFGWLVVLTRCLVSMKIAILIILRWS